MLDGECHQVFNVMAHDQSYIDYYVNKLMVAWFYLFITRL